MSYLLLVLKIIGITLLVILGVLLLIIALVLFVPIRYVIEGNKPADGDYNVSVKVTWLLHILNIKVQYLNDLFYRVRIFIITLVKSDNLKTEKDLKKEKRKAERKKKREEKKKKKEENKRIKEEKKRKKDKSNNNKSVECDDQSKDINDLNIKDDSVFTLTNENKIESAEKQEKLEEEIELEDDSNSEDEKKTLFEKIAFVLEKIIGFLFNIKDKVKRIIGKFVDIWNNIEYYIEAIEDERNKAALSLCLKQVAGILKNIKPKKIKGNLIYGSDDPYNVGKLMSIYGILFPIIHDKIQVVPEFDNEIIEGDIYIKGRITIFVIIKAAFVFYFNKDIRRMRKIFKKEKMN